MNQANYSYADLIADLADVCRRKKIGIKRIGRVKASAGDDSIYRLTINPSAKINFCIMAGVHGNEIAGPLSIIDLLENSEKYFDSRIKYFIYPVMSPSAFDRRTRRNAVGVNLNVFDKKTLSDRRYAEAKIFYNDVRDKKFAAFLSLHEDCDETRFYSYVFEKRSAPQPIYRRLIKEAGRQVEIRRARKIYGARSDGDGLVINLYDRSIEQFMFSRGFAYLSLATETPGELSLTIRKNINLKTINILSRHLMKG